MATFVYVGCAESNEIHVLRLDHGAGALSPVERVPIPGVVTPGQSTPMAVSPDRRVLYVGTRGEPKLAVGFAIDPAGGRLAHIASGPLAESMAYIVTDRTGRFLLGASYPGHQVTVNPISRPGAVGPPQQVLPDHPNAHAIRVDAANRHVLVPTLGNDRVNVFTFDATTGRLAPAGAAEVRAKAGPRHFDFHPAGRHVYVLGELDAAVYVFEYDARTGRLTETQRVSAVPSDFSGKPAAADLHVTPDGRFLYASVRASSTLASFRIDPASGTLAPIERVETERQPRGFNIDSTGRFLLAVGQLSHALSAYAIDPTAGTLTRLGQYQMGKNPNWVEIVDLPLMAGVRDRVAVVTGAAAGLGREIAQLLAREGARVTLGDVEPAGLERTAEAITKAGGTSLAVAGDLTEEAPAQRLIDACVERFGRVDILVNVVGGSRNAKIWEMSVADWDFVLRLNLRSTFLCTRAAVPHMMRQKHGRIVCMSSGAREGTPWTAYYAGGSAYSAAKAGVHGFVRDVALELAEHRINVNAVAPGPIDTERFGPGLKRLNETVEYSPNRMTPLRRLGEPFEVAHAVLFLASDEASYITGHTLAVTGGR